jgi:hypothetical protein
MKIMPFAILAAAGLGAWAFISSGKKLQSLDITPYGGNFKTIGIDAVTLGLDLSINNPGSDMKLQSISLNVIYKGSVIGSFSTEKNLTLKGKHANTIVKDITVRLSTTSLISELIKAYDGDYETILGIQGTIKADGLKFPVDKTIKIG